MNNNNDQYIALFNEDSGFNVDNISIKLNNDNNIYVDQVDNILIKNTLPFILLGSDISNNTIQTVLTNDYIIDGTINQSKILNLISDLLVINNKFNDYYLKTQTYSQTEINLLLNNYVTITTLITTLNNYYLKTETYSQTEINNLFYNKTYIDSFFYNKTYIDNLITSYYTKTQSDNLYYNKTYINNLIALYYTKTESDNKFALITSLSNYVLTTTLNSTLSNYVLTTTLNSTLANYVTNSSLTTTLSAYVTNNSLTTTLTSYYTKTAADNLFYTKTATDNLLTGKLSNVTYNADQANLALKFFSPLSSGNLRKSYFEYADLTNTKYIFFSQNGTNQYQTINFIDDNTLQASKLVDYSIGQTQLQTGIYDVLSYCYINFVDQSTGMLSLASLNTPASNGTYYLRANKTALLTQISWVDTSTLTPTFTLPFTILSTQSGYGSGDTCAFKIIQQTNRTTSTGAGFTVAHADNVALYLAQFGYNSSGRFPTVSPNYIQYQSPYAYIYSQDDIFLFCKSTVNNGISVRIQCMSNPDKVYISSNTNLNNWDLEKVRTLYVSDIYANTTNNAWTRVNNNLECNSIFKCDTLQAYSASNLISFNNNCTHLNNNINNTNNIFVSNINANTTNNTEIKFNNTINVNSNLIKNYNLDNQTFNKTTTGYIIQQLTLANTYAGWGCGAIGGSNICQFGLYEPTTQPSTATTRYSFIQTGGQSFQIGNSSLTYCTYSYSTTQSTVDFKNSLLKIDNLVSSSGNPINIGALNCIGTLNMNGNTIINCPSLGGSITGSNSIAVNTGGVNFLTQTNTTKSGTIIYGMSGSSFFHENQNGESVGFGCDGGSDNNTIWSPGDAGSVCNYQDEDSSNSRLCYINTSGTLTTVSSKTRKHSIKSKNNNNVLDRILKLNVKSYGYKYEFNDDDTEKKKQRMTNKSKKQQLGLILEEVYDILPNCCSFYDNELDDKLIDDENIKNKDVTFKNKPKLEDVKDISNMGINYTNILLYFIMAFQSYVKDNQNKNNDNSLITKNNLYINDRLDEIKVRLDNVEYNNLQPDDVYRIKNIINSQDSVYKCINDDINSVKLQNDILRDKYIDNIESNTIINKNLNEKIINLENKINTQNEDINFLKEENAKFKIALKMLLDRSKK
jgi:hypothetical protein